MANRSTRNKIRYQCKSAIDDLSHAQDHLTQIAVLASDSSQFIDGSLPQIMAFVDTAIKTVKLFYEKL